MDLHGAGLGLLGATSLTILAAGCSVRVGGGGPPSDRGAPGTSAAAGTSPIPFGPSACARLGAEQRLPFGTGATSFAFVWDGDHYVMVYSDPSTGLGDIYAVRLTKEGSPEAPPVVVQSTPATSDLPNLLPTATGFLAVWQEGSAGKSVYAHPLGPDARPTGSGGMIAATQSSESRPVLARAPGGRVAVTWMDVVDGKDAVQLALVDPASLTVSAPERMSPADVDGWPWIAGDDQVLGMVWSDRSSGTYDVRFASVNPNDLSPSSPVSLRDQPMNDGLLPRLSRTSFGFIAAWEDMRGSDNEIFMALLDSSGQKLGGGLVEEPDSGDANWPNIAFTGSSAGIVYYQWRDHRPQIFMSFVDSTGKRVGGLHDLQVSAGTTGWSRYPDVVWNGSDFAVVYVDTRDGPAALWMQRVSCPG